MTRLKIALICCVFVGLAGTVSAQESETPTEQTPTQAPKSWTAIPNPWFLGGAVGLAFGSETSYMEFSPIFGYQIATRFQIGGSLTFRYRKDKRYDPDLSTTDIGASVLGRYFVWGPIFIQGEVERLNWEYLALTENGDVVSVDSTYTGLYAGPGFVLASGPKSAMYMTFLWDFNYDKNVPSPNDDPFIIRIGYGFRF